MDQQEVAVHLIVLQLLQTAVLVQRLTQDTDIFR
jgi:hypothetical protein